MLDRWVRGERRQIWISKNEALLEDARRDWAALGGLPIDIQPLASWKLGTPIAMRDGILFVTYPTLRSGRRSEERREGKRVSVRVDLGGRRIIKKNKNIQQQYTLQHHNNKTK